MNHSTMVLLEGGETVYVQGRLAVSPFSTSTFGVTSTVTAPLHTVEKHDKAEIENITRRQGDEATGRVGCSCKFKRRLKKNEIQTLNHLLDVT